MWMCGGAEETATPIHTSPLPSVLRHPVGPAADNPFSAPIGTARSGRFLCTGERNCSVQEEVGHPHPTLTNGCAFYAHFVAAECA